MQKKIVIALIVLLMMTTALFSQTTGRLAGRVRDEDGNPVPYANVVLDGTEMGTQTRENGQYMIINIPPGEYDVRFSQIGYTTQLITGVRIHLDETTIQNVTLPRTALEIEGVDVTEARMEMVDRARTGTVRGVSADDIADLAVRDIEGIVALQAGVSMSAGELHVRGGRSDEVAYTVDGMSVSDPVDGGSPLTIDSYAIKEMRVMTGGFSAEFGNVQSGMVNIVTQDGGPEYFGRMEINSDHLLSDRNRNRDEIRFALGGPVLGTRIESLRDKFTFFFNTTAKWEDGRYKDYYVSDPVEELQYLTVDEFSAYNPYEGRDSFLWYDLGDRNFNDYNANLKLKYIFTPRSNISLAIRGDHSDRKPYSHSWKYALDNYMHYESDQIQYLFTYDHMFTSQMNLNVKASMFQREVRRTPKGINRDMYFSIDEDKIPIDPDTGEEEPQVPDPYGIDGIDYLLDDFGLYGPDRLYPWVILADSQERSVPGFIRPGNIYQFHQDDDHTMYALRADLEYHPNEIHALKTGFEVQKHEIRKNQLINAGDIDRFRYMEYLKNVAPADSVYNETEDIWIHRYNVSDLYDATVAASGRTDGYEANPWQGAYYIQDKMEWEGMIVNAGLRFDFWYLGDRYKVYQDDGSYVWQDFETDTTELMISPRLGVSHPITERSVLHFSYNYQNQLPRMQYIFTSVRPEDAITSPANIVIGEPSLDPQITVTYEVGLQQQLSEDYIMDIAAYFKNMYNYANTQRVYLQQDGSVIPWHEDPEDQTVPLYQYISEDYGSARGIDINLRRMLSHFISGSLSYSLAWATGNNSSATIQDETMNLREFPLDWDMRHNANLNVTFRVLRGEEFYLPFTDVLFPMDDFSIGFFYNISSGTPYTPADRKGNMLETNSARKPYQATADLRFSKNFNFTETTKLRLFLDINNLFNRKNAENVYARTGSPNDDGSYTYDEDKGYYVDTSGDYVSEEIVYIHNLAVNNPGNVSFGRNFSLGFSFEW